MAGSEYSLGSHLWHACAGNMVQMPPVNSVVFYFPQGHAEYTCVDVDFRSCINIPAYIPCRVVAINYAAEQETDEVYATLQLVPVSGYALDCDDGNDWVVGLSGSDSILDSINRPMSVSKTLTQSDLNLGTSFKVPRYCAENIFPQLDFSVEPAVQTLVVKDVHGKTWKFRHAYQGTPRRHILTTGWSPFVDAKKLCAGDSVIFFRAENGDVCVGIRRSKSRIEGEDETLTSSGWKPGFLAFPSENKKKLVERGNCTGSSSGRVSFQSENGNKFFVNSGTGSLKMRERVKPEHVLEAARLAAIGQPFEVVYYPRTNTPEFFVKASLVKAALQIHWSPGMRFKMAYETVDSSRLGWFMGTVLSVQSSDPIRWPNSPWKSLQVEWDEPDLVQNVKCVNPWLVELELDMPIMPHFSERQKKSKSNLPHDGQLQIPTVPVPSHPFVSHPDKSPAGMQGARHAQTVSSFFDFNKLQHDLVAACFPLLHHAAIPSKPTGTPIDHNLSTSQNVSHSLTIRSSFEATREPEDDKVQEPQFVLFGQPILTEDQISSDGNANKTGNISGGSSSALNPQGLPEQRSSCEGVNSKSDLKTGHCKIYLDYEEIGYDIDLSSFESYQHMCKRLGNLMDIESSEMENRLRYRDVTGAVKQLGEDPFSEFLKRARILTILSDSSSDTNTRI